MTYRALVFGASGITGWAVTKAALEYPTATTFDRVIALVNRPLSMKESRLPEDHRLQLHSGIDLSSKETLVASLQSIEGIHEVTHVYFAAYVAHKTPSETKRSNLQILENSVLAIENLCPNLKFWTLQTGGKVYGVEFADKLELVTPFRETLPRVSQPFQNDIFYYAQYDILSSLAANKKWKFVEIRPDVISGFVPRGNAMNIAHLLGLYLSFYRFVEGDDAKITYPGPLSAYKATHTDTSQDILAHFHIFASLHDDFEGLNGRSFNIGNGDTVSWELKWSLVCKYFGLHGIGPNEDDKKPTGVNWIREHKDKWRSWEESSGVPPGTMSKTDFGFMEFILVNANFNREYDLTASRSIGFSDSVDTVQSYYDAFDKLRASGGIP